MNPNPTSTYWRNEARPFQGLRFQPSCFCRWLFSFGEKVEETQFEFVRTLMVMCSAWRRARLGSKQSLEESKMAKMMREDSTSATCLARRVGKKTAYFSVR